MDTIKADWDVINGVTDAGPGSEPTSVVKDGPITSDNVGATGDVRDTGDFGGAEDFDWSGLIGWKAGSRGWRATSETETVERLYGLGSTSVFKDGVVALGDLRASGDVVGCCGSGSAEELGWSEPTRGRTASCGPGAMSETETAERPSMPGFFAFETNFS